MYGCVSISRETNWSYFTITNKIYCLDVTTTVLRRAHPSYVWMYDKTPSMVVVCILLKCRDRFALSIFSSIDIIRCHRNCLFPSLSLSLTLSQLFWIYIHCLKWELFGDPIEKRTNNKKTVNVNSLLIWNGWMVVSIYVTIYNLIHKTV